MKKLLLILLITLSTTAVFAQKPTKKGDFNQYITKDSITLKVGDTISIGLPSNGNQYIFITQANMPAGPTISSTDVVIHKLKSVGTKRRGYKMYATFKGYGLPVYIDIENAIKTEEIELYYE